MRVIGFKKSAEGKLRHLFLGIVERGKVNKPSSIWELRGYHIYGDPWREQRYSGD